MLELLTAIIFFFIGRWSIRSTERKELIEKVVQSIKKRNTLKPGVIPFKTPEDFEREENGDKALEEHWKKSGISDILRKE